MPMDSIYRACQNPVQNLFHNGYPPSEGADMYAPYPIEILSSFQP